MTLAEQDLSGTVLALDFDGVLCDSEPELTRSAWRAARERWPELMESAASMSEQPWKAGARKAWAAGDGWEPLQGNGADGLPNWLAAKMRLLRPVLETGFESVLMMRLCADEALMAASSARITVGAATPRPAPQSGGGGSTRIAHVEPPGRTAHVEPRRVGATIVVGHGRTEPAVEASVHRPVRRHVS